MACSFDDTGVVAPLLYQLRDYCLTFMPEGMCAVQKNQLLLVCSPEEADDFQNGRCSDIELTETTDFDGNRVFYTYKGIDIILYKIVVNR